MCNQLKVTFFKLRHFWLFIIVVVFMAGIGFFHGYIKLASLVHENGMYDAFIATNCDTSFIFLLALVSASFIGSDFSNRTIHHEITTGYSRWSVLVVRELSASLSAVILHFTFIICTMIGVGIKTGFSVDRFENRDLFWCVVILLQLSALQSIIVLITFICAKASVAIAASVCFTFLMCNVLRNFFDGIIFKSSCFCLVQNNAYETLIPTSMIAVLTLIVTITVTYFVFRKKEIK